MVFCLFHRLGEDALQVLLYITCSLSLLLSRCLLEPTRCLRPRNGKSDSVTIIRIGDPVGSSLHCRGGIAHRNTESHQAEQRQVILPIANGHHVGWRDAKLLSQSYECRGFIHAILGDLQVVGEGKLPCAARRYA